MREFDLLTADEIECRVQSTKTKGVILLLYKTARTDAKILDEKFGIFGWQNKFEEIHGNMYCSIGIFSKEQNEWIWKSDCGVESNTEKEKGEASDSFKRAGFKWGIGAELYSSPFIWINADDIVIENERCMSRFNVAEIGYDKNENINHLVITASDSKGKDRPVFIFGKNSQKPKQDEAKSEPKKKQEDEKPKEKLKIYCAYCGNEIVPAKRKNGTTIPVETLIKESSERYGKCYCAKCLGKKIKEDKEKENA